MEVLVMVFPYGPYGPNAERLPSIKETAILLLVVQPANAPKRAI